MALNVAGIGRHMEGHLESALSKLTRSKESQIHTENPKGRSIFPDSAVTLPWEAGGRTVLRIEHYALFKPGQQLGNIVAAFLPFISNKLPFTSLLVLMLLLV